MTTDYDVLIIGGSYAGLSAAMALGRSHRKVLIIDSHTPCNRFTPNAHNFITQDGVSPATIAALSKKQVLAYPSVSFQEGLVTSITGSDNNFTITATASLQVAARKLIFATGLKDILPAIPGFADCWGTSIIHCPYCHGYEVSGQPTGIMVNDASALHFVQLISNWTNELALFTNGDAAFDLSPILDLNVPIIQKKVASFEHQNGKLSSILFADGSASSITALYHRPPFEQQCSLPTVLGCKLTSTGHLEVDGSQQTTINGIYAVGDATQPFRSLAFAVYSGSTAGAMLNHALIAEQYALL